MKPLSKLSLILLIILLLALTLFLAIIYTNPIFLLIGVMLSIIVTSMLKRLK